MNLHKGHRKRVRDRFIAGGLETFPEHNALELMLFYALPQGDTNNLAHELINHFGGLHGVFEARFEDLCKFKGLGEVSATMIKLVPAMTSYYQSRKALLQDKIDTSFAASEYFIPRLMNSTNEELHMMSLNNRGGIIKCTKLHEGTVNVVQIVTRTVLAEALGSNATSVILAHNHPSGVTIPSTNDVFVTKTLYNVLYQSNIFLMDHIIVSGNNYSSMRELGWFDGLPVFGEDSI